MTQDTAACPVPRRPSGDGWYDIPRDRERFDQFRNRVQTFLTRAREDITLDNLWALHLNQALGEIAWLRSELDVTPIRATPSSPPTQMADALEAFIAKLAEGQYRSVRDDESGEWHHDRHVFIYLRNAIASLRACASTQDITE